MVGNTPSEYSKGDQLIDLTGFNNREKPYKVE
jgi:hypothetical protein